MKKILPPLLFLIIFILVIILNFKSEKFDYNIILYKAVVSSDWTSVKLSLEKGANPNYIINEKSMMMYAIDNKDVRTIKLLLFYNASSETHVQSSDMLSGENIINMDEYAIQSGDIKCFQEVTKGKQIDINFLLFQSVLNDKVNIAKYLIEKGANINTVYAQGRGCIFFVKSVEMADLLYKNKVNLRVVDNDGNSPLHSATNEKMIIWFVLHGINPKIGKSGVGY